MQPGFLVASENNVTDPRPFSFTQRDEEKQKNLMRIKMEQQLALKQEEEKAARRLRRFKANPVPTSTLEPRFQRIMVEEEIRRRTEHERAVSALKGMEQPFSFYYKDLENQRRKEEHRRIMRDPARYRRAFRANEPPPSTYEDRYRQLLAEEEIRKLRVKERAAMLLAESSLPPRMEQGMPTTASRPHSAAAASRGRDPSADLHGGVGGKEELRRPYSTRRLGRVPDFQRLHTDFQTKLLRFKASNPFRRTVPEEFRLGGKTREEAEARERKAEERRRRLEEAMLEEEKTLKELRWPFMSTREKVTPTQPPASWGAPGVSVGETRAQRLRKEATEEARKSGRYKPREEREREAAERVRKEHEKFAKMYIKKKLAEEREAESMRRALDGPAPAATTSAPPAAAPSTSAPAAAAASKSNTSAGTGVAPAEYLQARHQQEASKAREAYENVLLDLDLYRYVEVQSSGDEGSAVGKRAKAVKL
jgi:hypothetical protein